MSFAMSVDKNFEYSGSLIGMLANYKNLIDKNYHKMIYDIFRFFKLSPKYLKKIDDDCTLDEFLNKFNFSNQFIALLANKLDKAISIFSKENPDITCSIISFILSLCK